MATEMDGQAAGTKALYMEDLEVGQRFISGTETLGEDQITAFAAQFDPQVFHLDPVAARDSLFGGLAASGWHTAAVTMRLLVTGEMRLAGGMIGAGAELSWPAPTRPGDVLQVESEILELVPSRSRSDRGMATIRSQTFNQRREIVQQLVAKVIVLRNPAAAV